MKTKAFIIVELIVAVEVIAILAGVIVFGYGAVASIDG
jgi:type II secretory pathway pseudopilin PulG